PDAARAMNAAGHVGCDQRPEILVLHRALALGITRDVPAESDRKVLKLALAALVADWAVERVIDEQELHRRPLRADGTRGLCEDLHALSDGSGTRRQRLRCLLDLDQAHAAVRRDGQLVVITEARDVGAMRVCDANDHLALRRLHSNTVDLYVDE